MSLTLGPDILTLLDEYALEHKMSRSAAVEKLLGLGLRGVVMLQRLRGRVGAR